MAMMQLPLDLTMENIVASLKEHSLYIEENHIKVSIGSVVRVCAFALYFLVVCCLSRLLFPPLVKHALFMQYGHSCVHVFYIEAQELVLNICLCM